MIDNLHEWAIAWNEFNEELDQGADLFDHWGPTPPVGPSHFDTREEERGER
jgi:hypothetical protein